MTNLEHEAFHIWRNICLQDGMDWYVWLLKYKDGTTIILRRPNTDTKPIFGNVEEVGVYCFGVSFEDFLDDVREAARGFDV